MRGLVIDWENGGGEPLACRHYQGKDPETGFPICRLRSETNAPWCLYTLFGAASWCKEYVGPKGFLDCIREARRRKLVLAQGVSRLRKVESERS